MRTRFLETVALAGVVLASVPGWATDPAREFGMRGLIALDKRTEVVTFDLTIGSRGNHYRVEGNTQPAIGLYESDYNLGAIEVRKGEEVFETDGDVLTFPRKRKLSGVVIAGLPARGQFIQGAFNDGLFLDGLEIDGQESKGLVDYNGFTGCYKAKRGLRFGDQKIASQVAGSNLLSNHDNLIGQNRTKMTMVFGDLAVSGLVYFNDQVQTTVDSDGKSSSHVVATAGRYSLSITKVDGRLPTLSAPGEKPTADDITLRKLIGFFVLFSYDMLQ